MIAPLAHAFIQAIQPVQHSVFASLGIIIKYSKVLNINSRWLYKPSLYTLEPNDEDIIFKIKALTYADNPRLQNNADKKISVESLQDKQG